MPILMELTTLMASVGGWVFVVDVTREVGGFLVDVTRGVGGIFGGWVFVVDVTRG